MIHEVIIRQADRCFYFISSAVSNSDETAWANQGDDGLGVWQHTVHMIDTLRFYCSRDALKEYTWKNPFGLNYEQHDADPPAMSDVLQYAQVSKEHVSQLITDHAQDMLSKEETCPWVGSTYLDRLIYVIRHTTHHVGSLNSVLKKHKCQVVRQDR